MNANQGKDFILKSLLCARILQAITVLCPNFKKCCSTGSSDDWEKVQTPLIKASLEFWRHWMDDVIAQITELSSQVYDEMGVISMLQIYHVSFIIFYNLL